MNKKVIRNNNVRAVKNKGRKVKVSEDNPFKDSQKNAGIVAQRDNFPPGYKDSELD